MPVRLMNALIRIVKVVIVLFIVTFGTFGFVAALPGNPVDILVPPGGTEAQRHAVIEEFRLNDPLWVRYLAWLGQLLHGNLGRSIINGEPVGNALLAVLPVTLEIAGLALLVALVIALPVGVYCGYRPGRAFDQFVSFVTSGMLAIPSYLLAVLLVFFFSVSLKLLPISGWVPFADDPAQHFLHLVLPVFCLALIEAGVFIRLLRNDMAATLQEDFALAARARGLSTGRILIVHALRPSSLSLVTVLGLVLASLIGGTIIVESAFSLPGMGNLLVTAVRSHDYPVVQGAVLIVAIGYIIINLVVDSSYRLFDPRVELQGR